MKLRIALKILFAFALVTALILFSRTTVDFVYKGF